jgi:hypothetical protein
MRGGVCVRCCNNVHRNFNLREFVKTCKSVTSIDWTVEDVRPLGSPTKHGEFLRYSFEVLGVCSEGAPKDRFGEDVAVQQAPKAAASPEATP